jgi:tetratricopeptide (TPR) repeat protein
MVVLAAELSDHELRRIREELQSELEAISSINLDVRSQCAVWSVHIPYDSILAYLRDDSSPQSATGDERGLSIAVDDIVNRTKSALKVIWQVRAADAALRRRDYREADRKLGDALVLDEQNSYIWRHRAEARIGLGRYLEAENAARRAIEIEEAQGIAFASSYQRLAEACFGQGEYEKSFTAIQHACTCSRDLRYRRAMIQLLILHAEPASLNRALEMIIDTTERAGSVDARDLAWLERMRGEARLCQGEPSGALEAFEKAASMNPDYQDIDWDICRARWARKMVSAH